MNEIYFMCQLYVTLLLLYYRSLLPLLSLFVLTSYCCVVSLLSTWTQEQSSAAAAVSTVYVVSKHSKVCETLLWFIVLKIPHRYLLHLYQSFVLFFSVPYSS